MFIAAPAQFGQHNSKYASFGHSALVDPWGTVTSLAPEGRGITYGEIDLEHLTRVRQELPMGVGG